MLDESPDRCNGLLRSQVFIFEFMVSTSATKSCMPVEGRCAVLGSRGIVAYKKRRPEGRLFLNEPDGPDARP